MEAMATRTKTSRAGAELSRKLIVEDSAFSDWLR
jgi:hypothetical protein